ncbi:MAG: acyltransferase [Sedimentisphaerales bacterium]|nr:acyltransferase [Sedimentisphaerales bacterium]
MLKKTAKKAPRLRDIDVAKGLGISLVVLGHVLAKDTFPKDNQWFLDMWSILYKFHMPFFMYLSGFVMMYTYRPLHTLKEYGSYVGGRFNRLMPAYLLFALIILVGKLLFQTFFEIPNAVSWEKVAYVFIKPRYSYCGFLWYIYVLFIYYVIFPPLIQLFKHQVKWIVLGSFVIYFLPRNSVLASDQVMEYMFMFSLGILAASDVRFVEIVERGKIAFILLFFVSLLVCYFVDVPKILQGFIATLGLHALVRIKGVLKFEWLVRIGKYTFPIYLLHMIIMGFIRMVAQKTWGWDGWHFLIVGPVLFASGLVGPIILQRYIIQKIPCLNRIIR